MDKVPKGKLAAKLGLHYPYIPPIEEAFNSLQKFLQEEFPKLIEDINLSSTSTSNGLIDGDDDEAFVDNNDTCGSFSTLPVRLLLKYQNLSTSQFFIHFILFISISNLFQDETVLKILKNLDLKSLSRCCKLNRHFNNIARDALLYTSLNLKPYWHCMDTNALNNLALRCKYLQRLDLSWCGNYGTILSEDFIEFLRNCGNLLTHLRLNCCKFTNDAVIREISVICKNLKGLFDNWFNVYFIDNFFFYSKEIRTLY